MLIPPLSAAKARENFCVNLFAPHTSRAAHEAGRASRCARNAASSAADDTSGRSSTTHGFGAAYVVAVETPLTGGRITAGVVRVGDTVRRPPKPNASLVRALLGRLEQLGLELAP